jgi:hypothetical protein
MLGLLPDSRSSIARARRQCTGEHEAMQTVLAQAEMVLRVMRAGVASAHERLWGAGQKNRMAAPQTTSRSPANRPIQCPAGETFSTKTKAAVIHTK